MEGHVRGGAAHIEADEAFDSERARDGGGSDQPSRRAGQNCSRGLRGCLGDRDRAAVGLEDAQLRSGQGRREGFDIARHQRRDVGVDHGGRRPFVLAILGEDLAGQRHAQAGCPQRLADKLLVGGVGVAVQQADRHRVDISERGSQACERAKRERLEHGAVVEHPLVQAELLAFGDQAAARRGRPVVQVGAILPSELEQVLEAASGDERRACARALQQSVGGHGGAVHDLAGGKQFQAGQYRARRVGGGRSHLVAAQARAVPCDEVRERPAAVDSCAHVGYQPSTGCQHPALSSVGRQAARPERG